MFASDELHLLVRVKEAKTSGMGAGVGNEPTTLAPKPELAMAPPNPEVMEIDNEHIKSQAEALVARLEDTLPRLPHLRGALG